MKHLSFPAFSHRGQIALGMLLLLFWPFIAQAQSTSYITEQVEITGLVEKPLTIHMKNVDSFGAKTVAFEQKVTNASGEVKKVRENFRGVLLTDLLEKAEVKLPFKKARGEFYVLVTASDGYKVIFAWNELQFGPAGQNTWLIFEENGQPITEEGKFVLLCTSDLVRGPRHVKWVANIEVKRIP